MDKELRIIETADFGIETRTVKRADGEEVERSVIVGKAVTFNTYSQVLGWFREQIVPAAFEGCDMSDVVCLKNHDNNLILGRTADTLSLEVRNDGLYFTAYPPDTQAARDALEEIRSKMIRGCSFQFSIAPGGSDWDTDPATGAEIRTIKKISKLYDVGPVTFPAYLDTNTDVAKRDYDSAKAEREQQQQEQQEQPPVDPFTPIDVFQRRARALSLV
ncbi:HK97 family phage prohead protease [Fibrisoma montanum]|uniref:HK97 family phage prohead protease n=1 Tax=Fibrisoma montanum TaxID=2305895 RepID=A0A418M3H8_9BACT|nr:HK97 family phage prohead protease [Fibrisoma montanum]RIV20322.1 HK97 family phage prohead protease [Fibrisoma montanum]